MLDLEVRYSRAISRKKKKKKNMPRLPLLSVENENKDEINRMPHWVFDLFTLTKRSIFPGFRD